MVNDKTTEVSAQGAETQPIDKENVTKWLKKDIASSISLLNAVYTDPDLMDHIATFMLGRFENARHTPKLPD